MAMRDDRYVLPVRAECRGAIPGVVHARSQSGATLYVEPEEILADGNELAGLCDLPTKIRSRGEFMCS